MFTGQSTQLSNDYYQVKMGGDASLLKGIMKALIEMDEARIYWISNRHSIMRLSMSILLDMQRCMMTYVSITGRSWNRTRA